MTVRLSYGPWISFCAFAALAGCSSSVPKSPLLPDTSRPTVVTYPDRPTIAAPPFKVFHQDNDTYTLVTKGDASEDEIAATLWQLRDAARTHGFDQLKLSQTFIDGRKPSIWFHVYRGSKCATEKFTKGKLPCEPAYHGAGDFTLGAYGNPAWNDGVLRSLNGKETHLWDADANNGGSAR
jgi:hypothetical protein